MYIERGQTVWVQKQKARIKIIYTLKVLNRGCLTKQSMSLVLCGAARIFEINEFYAWNMGN